MWLSWQGACGALSAVILNEYWLRQLGGVKQRRGSYMWLPVIIERELRPFITPFLD
jgi:hypothetical protein